MNKLINHWENPKTRAATLIPKTANPAIGGKVVYCQQVHGNRVVEIKKAGGKVKPVCDGLVTKQIGITLVVQTADCIPIFFVEEELNIIGVIHAGWRGTLASIAVETLKLIHNLGGNPKSTKVHLGPHINKCCYGVSADLANKFEKFFGNETTSYIAGKYYLDLGLVTRIQLMQNKVKPENITSSQQCTFCDNSLFSYRRSKINKIPCGSMYSYIENIPN